MIDIHCHLLDGIDDGAKTLKESVEMDRFAYEDGIRHIIATTPHFCNTFMTETSLGFRKLNNCNRSWTAQGLPLRYTQAVK